jgi:S1-C subfamily serine protease
MTNDGTVVPVREVLAASKEDDVAILRIDAGERRFRPLVLSTDAPVASSVCVISHPARRFYSLTRGIVSRYFLVAAGEKPAVPRMHITADFARGSSGGPLFNKRGAVVGLVKSTASIYYDVSEGKKDSLQMVFKECIPASQVLKLIEQK